MSVGLFIGPKSPNLHAPARGMPALAAAPRSYPVTTAPGPEVAALVLHEPSQHHVVDLGSAIDEARLPRVAVDPFQDSVLGIAARAVELDRDVGGLMQGVGDVHL